MYSYAAASIPEPCRILGLKLYPFSLGHYLLMRRFDVAFASDDTCQASMEDLVLGVLICSHTYEGFLEFIDKPTALKEIEEWGDKVFASFEFPEKVKVFNDFINEGLAIPPHWQPRDESAKRGGSHWSHALKTTLVSQLGYTLTQAMNEPLQQAFGDYFRYLETIGAIRLKTIEDQIITENLKRQSEVSCV